MVTSRTRAEFRSFLPNGRTRLLGILGDPIAHSLSPELHSAVLRHLDQNMLYLPIPVSAPRLGKFLGLAGDLGFVGCNVTTPFKERVLRAAEPRDTETKRTRMANTLSFPEGRRPLAEGTDGRGILGWLGDQGLGDEPFAVLGFGATARSLVHAAWSRGTPPVLVVTRRPGPVRRRLLAWAGVSGRPRLKGPGPEVVAFAPGSKGSPGGAVPWAAVRVWVSTWPPGAVPPPCFWDVVSRRSVLLDLNYGPGRVSLADVARREGLRAADGLGPLLQQAARSLSVWLDRPVEAELFRKAAGVPRIRLRPSR